jgi:hypothetical protein
VIREADAAALRKGLRPKGKHSPTLGPKLPPILVVENAAFNEYADGPKGTSWPSHQQFFLVTAKKDYHDFARPSVPVKQATERGQRKPVNAFENHPSAHTWQQTVPSRVLRLMFSQYIAGLVSSTCLAYPVISGPTFSEPD